MSDLSSSLQKDQAGTLPALLGFEWTRAEAGLIEGRVDILPHHLAPTGYLHAATVVALADTACGYGCRGMLPDAAKGFTTAELKANFLGTSRAGLILCRAQVVHAGRTTQVWDAEVFREGTNKPIALFRCTQVILYRDMV